MRALFLLSFDSLTHSLTFFSLGYSKPSGSQPMDESINPESVTTAVNKATDILMEAVNSM